MLLAKGWSYRAGERHEGSDTLYRMKISTHTLTLAPGITHLWQADLGGRAVVVTTPRAQSVEDRGGRTGRLLATTPRAQSVEAPSRGSL